MSSRSASRKFGVSRARVDLNATRDDPVGYAALIASVGYESRASYISRVLVNQRLVPVWAYGYPHNHELHYEANARFFQSVGTVFNEADSAYRKDLASRIRQRHDEVAAASEQIGLQAKVRFAVDISSMDRDRLARTVLALSVDQEVDLEVDFLYAFAEFDDRIVGSEGRVTVNHSIDGLDGWTEDPNLPLACLVGAGFESRLALAALETLEPATSIWLFPTSPDTRYDELVRERNQIVLADDPIAASYRVDEPYLTIQELEATVASLVRDHRVVLVPLGPKIFALSSILVGLAYDTNVTVWRLSADSDRLPEDRSATGNVVGLRVAFGGYGDVE